MSLTGEILSKLKSVFDSGVPVRLINEFKGLPIVHHAGLLEVTPTGVVVSVHPQQAVCLHLEKFTFIQSGKLPFILRAEVESVDLVTCVARLHNILYGSDTVGGRMQVRVQPALPAKVTVEGRNRLLHGELADISLVGVGMYAISAFMYNPVTLKRGTDVTVRISLESEGEIELPGTILYVTREGDTFRLGVRTQPDDQTRNRLGGFINLRRVELETELDVLYSELSRNG
jgi:hypothetical protein